MERTINGKGPAEFLAEFLAPLPQEQVKRREDGYYYFPYDVYEERLLEIVGFFNFEIKCEEPRIEMVLGKPMASKSGSLIIYYDDGREAKKVTVGAGEELTLSRKEKAVINFSNTQKRLDRDVLINAMQAMGIGRGQLSRLNKKPDVGKSPAAANGNGARQINAYEITFLKKVVPIRNGYKSEVRVSGKDCELLIWKDGVEMIEKHMKIDDFCAQAQPQMKLRIKGHYTTYQGRAQLVMVSFA